MSAKETTNLFIDMFLHIVFLLVGLVMALPTLLAVGTDIFAYIFSFAFIEYFTIMMGVLVVVSMVMYLVLQLFFDTRKMNVWLYYILNATVISLWIALFMTSFFSVGVITASITNFIVLVALVFITGLLGPMVRLVVKGK